jgi:hypothetical protein
MTNTTKLSAAVADFRACPTDHDTDAAALKAVAARHKGVTEAALQEALETPAVTKVPTGAATTARGKRAGRESKAKLNVKAPRKAKAPTKRTAATKDKAPKAKATKGNTFTTVDLAAEQGINAKTLRARIRRNIDRWSPLFKDGEKHVFADSATTRKAVAALLDA